MGWFRSKTKYYVSSSTSPIFDPTHRVNQYEAAMLDYTANSPLEMSEYMKKFFGGSRLRNYYALLNWCERSGFYKTFGKVQTSFNSDAHINEVQVANSLKPHIKLPPNAQFSVFGTTLSFFSEDAYIKHVATLQGHAKWFYEEANNEYTISYPQEGIIRATFKKGHYVQGALPKGDFNRRWLSTNYSVIYERQVTKEVTVKKEVLVPDEDEPKEQTSEPVTKEETPEKPKQKFKKVLVDVVEKQTSTEVVQEYGYYSYEEGTGIPGLDNLIKNNGIRTSNAFFPVIPLRANTSWFVGHQAELIGQALEHIDLFGKKTRGIDCYKKLQEACTSGMQEGNIGDIDYITMVLGVSICSPHKAETRYIFEFFKNLHLNSQLQQGVQEKDLQAKDLTNNDDLFGQLILKIKQANEDHLNKGCNLPYHSYQINCSASNLHLAYSWGYSDFFKVNGRFKPDAKPGAYGVLGTTLVYPWQHSVPEYDKNGRCTYRQEWRQSTYEVTLFCHQISANRWEFCIFTELKLVNNVYAGKTIDTSALSAITSVPKTGDITHHFHFSDPQLKNYETLSMKYIIAGGDLTSPFIVPLEGSTFKKIGAVNQLEISYASQFLIFNCWVKKKKRWYQRGWFAAIVSVVGVVAGCAMPALAPAIGSALGPLMTGVFSVTLVMSVTAKALSGTLKVLQIIFGKRLGAQIYGIMRSFVGVLCSFIARIPVIGWAIAAFITFAVTSGEALNNGDSMWKAFLKGVKAGAVSVVSSYTQTQVTGFFQGAGYSASVANAAGSGAYSAVQTVGDSIGTGQSFGSILKQGAISGVTSASVSFLSDGLKDTLSKETAEATKEATKVTTEGAKETAKKVTLKTALHDFAVDGVLKNPNTYANLAKLTQEEIQFHKLANLENDYQEFANNAHAAQRTLQTLTELQTSSVTAEFVCKLQSNIGRVLTTFPEMNQNKTPDSFLTMALSVGSDHVKGSLCRVPSYVETKLTLDGFRPSPLHYTQMDYSLIWDYI